MTEARRPAWSIPRISRLPRGMGIGTMIDLDKDDPSTGFNRLASNRPSGSATSHQPWYFKPRSNERSSASKQPRRTTAENGRVRPLHRWQPISVASPVPTLLPQRMHQQTMGSAWTGSMPNGHRDQPIHSPAALSSCRTSRRARHRNASMMVSIVRCRSVLAEDCCFSSASVSEERLSQWRWKMTQIEIRYSRCRTRYRSTTASSPGSPQLQGSVPLDRT